MNVNKFGQTKLAAAKNFNSSLRGPPGVGFKLTQDGNYDVDNKRILNIEQLPIAKNEVASKLYVDLLIDSLKKEWINLENHIKDHFGKFENSINEDLKNFDTKYNSLIQSIQDTVVKSVNELQLKFSNLEFTYTQELFALRKTYADSYNIIQSRLERNTNTFAALKTKLSSTEEVVTDLSLRVDKFMSNINSRLVASNIQPIPIFHKATN